MEVIEVTDGFVIGYIVSMLIIIATKILVVKNLK